MITGRKEDGEIAKLNNTIIVILTSFIWLMVLIFNEALQSLAADAITSKVDHVMHYVLISLPQ